MLEKFSWEGLSSENESREKIQPEARESEAPKNEREESRERNFEIPNSVDGKIIENPDGTITFSTKHGDLLFSADKFKDLCPDWKKGEARVSFIDGEKLAKSVLKELLDFHEDIQE